MASASAEAAPFDQLAAAIEAAGKATATRT